MRENLLGIILLALLIGCGNTFAQKEEGTSNEEFSDIKTPADYTRQVDRRRGVITIKADQAKYVPGDHFADWHWQETLFRAGSYFVALNYNSKRSKLGVRANIGDCLLYTSPSPRDRG